LGYLHRDEIQEVFAADIHSSEELNEVICSLQDAGIEVVGWEEQPETIPREASEVESQIACVATIDPVQVYMREMGGCHY
jgi:hypothetical protein